MSQAKLLLRVSEAADRLSISRAFLYEQIAAGRLRALKIGAATRIPASELERFIKECAGESEPAAGGNR